jgi:nicotinic acid mononucleotide adenylyltransferase
MCEAIVKKSERVYFTFGRFQPPTTGHGLLIQTLAERAQEIGADNYIFVSSRCNDLPKYMRIKKYKNMEKSSTFESCVSNENPLRVDQKIHYLQKMFPSATFINTTECECPQLFRIVHLLKDSGYTDIHMLVGADRVETFSRVLASKGILVEGIDRPPGAISGTKMRLAAVRGNIETLKAGTMIGQMTEADVLRLQQDILTGLAMKGGKGRQRYRVRNKTQCRRRYRLRSDEK